jgi:hypothetical protein
MLRSNMKGLGIRNTLRVCPSPPQPRRFRARALPPRQSLPEKYAFLEVYLDSYPPFPTAYGGIHLPKDDTAPLASCHLS